MFPNLQYLQNKFQPLNCCKVMAKEVEAITKWPQVTLSQIDDIYQTNDLAEYFAKLLFSTIYAQGNSGATNCNQSVVNMQAGLFLAQYGRQCTMFDYMLYMGTYRSKYKPDYVSNGDLSDIIKRFPDYLKHKGSIMEAHKPQPKTETRTSEKEPVGIAGLEVYLIKAAKRGDNLFESALLGLGVFTKEHAQELMDKYAPQAF